MVLVYFIIGIGAGILGGLLGIGGGSVLIPIFVYFLGFTQHEAQGTTLALMVPPLGLLAAYKYLQEGHVKIPVAICVAIGLFIGGYFGAVLAHKISEPVLRKLFGLFLVLVGMRMFLGK